MNVAPYFIPDHVEQELLRPYSVRPVQRVQGGLSGAQVWRCDSQCGPLCLRVWPVQHPTPARIRLIHEAMRRARTAGLTFVPEVYRTRDGSTFLSCQDHHWELSQWMPGQADYAQHRTQQRLAAAMHALARLHLCWAQDAVQGPSPTVAQRLGLLTDWLSSNHSLKFKRSPDQPLEYALARGTLEQLSRLGPALLNQLQRLVAEPVTLHFVMRDIWSEHLLFVGQSVGGIIDFAAGRRDEPAADVARLVGSLEPLDASQRQIAIDYYLQLNGAVCPERVQLLDRTGALLSALQWLQWLLLEARQFDVPAEMTYKRWQSHLARLADFPT